MANKEERLIRLIRREQSGKAAITKKYVSFYLTR